jgi:hypothetical protein
VQTRYLYVKSTLSTTALNRRVSAGLGLLSAFTTHSEQRAPQLGGRSNLPPMRTFKSSGIKACLSPTAMPESKKNCREHKIQEHRWTHDSVCVAPAAQCYCNVSAVPRPAACTATQHQTLFISIVSITGCQQKELTPMRTDLEGQVVSATTAKGECT